MNACPMKARILVFCMALASTPVLAQSSGGSFTLEKHTIDSGGGTSTGGSYSLQGTIGQPDAGRLEGGSYVIEGGFWASASGQTADLVFADSYEN